MQIFLKFLSFTQTYSGAITALATVVLAVLTFVYVFFTKKTLSETIKQSKLSLVPIIGVSITNSVILKSNNFLSIDIELANLGTAAALDIVVDSEIQLKYSEISGRKVIPMKNRVLIRQFIRPNYYIKDKKDKYGTTVEYGFNLFYTKDLVEALNKDFNELVFLDSKAGYNTFTPILSPFHTTKLIIYVYYKNSLDQYFYSRYETEIAYAISDINSETQAVFHSRERNKSSFNTSTINKADIGKEIKKRDELRELFPWK